MRRGALLLALMTPIACTGLGGLSGGTETDGGAGADAMFDDAPRVDGAGDAVPGGNDAPSEANDAPAQDAPAPADAGDAGPSNLVPNPSFDQGTGGCGVGWTGYGTTFARSTDARTGASSCELCALTGTTSFELDPAGQPFDVVAGSYYAEAWIHAPAGDASMAGGTGVQVRFNPADGGAQQYFQANMITPSGTWTSSAEAIIVPGPGTLTFDVHSYFPNDGCVLVDDVMVVLQ